MRLTALLTVLFLGVGQPAGADPYEDLGWGDYIWGMADWGLAGDEDYDDGIAAFSRAIASGALDMKDLAIAHGMRGDLYQDMDMTSSAASDYRRAIELWPNGDNATIARERLIEMGESP